jgi:TonB family protein
MPWILVAESQGRFAERIRDGLAADGWQIEIVPTVAEAERVAAARAPELVIVNAELAGAADFIARRARRSGGGGAIALVAEAGGGQDVAAAADERLTQPINDQDLRLAVRRLATAGRAPKAPPPPADEARLTSRDLFGDVLAEMEAEMAPARPAPAAPPPAPPAPPKPARPVAGGDVDRALERTLSGLLDEKKSKPVPAAGAKKSAGGVDDLLSRTLGGLEGTDRPRKAAAPPAAAPPAAAPPAPVAAPAPAPPPPPAPPAAAARAASPEPPPAPEIPVRAPQPPPAETAMPAIEALRRMPTPEPPRRPSHEIDLSALDLLAKPKPREKEPSKPAPAAETFGTQKVALPPSLGGKPASNEFGQYTLLERIAVGGMAELWKARMKGVEGFQKTVAIKKILPHLTDSSDFVTMFIDEAKLAAQLNHNNIIHIYDLGKLGDDYYIAMEFVDGRDLRSILNTAREKNQALPMGLALLVASRLAAALDYAHRMKDFEGRPLGLVHRDVSPQNVLISFEGDIKLCDFGIVKAVSKASKTQMGALKGKLQYMSPEQAWGRPVDARSDIFSLGSLLFEMLTGRRLFAGESEMSVLDAVREGRIQAPRDLDPRLPLEVNAVTLRALGKEPSERFQTAGELQRELESILASLKPPPSTHELAGYVRRLYGVEPRVELPPAATAAIPAAVAAPSVPVAPAPAPPKAAVEVAREIEPSRAGVAHDEALEPSAGRGKLWIAIAAVVVLAVAGWYLFGRGGTPEAAPAPDAQAPAPPATPESAPPAAPDATGAPVAPQAAPAVDVEQAVGDEVKKREEELRRQYAAELERKQRELEAARTPEPAPAPAPAAATSPAPAAPVASPEPEVAPAAPAPAPQPEPEPVAPAPAPVVEQRPAPAPVTPPAPAPAPRPTVKEGDLVQPGPGVRPPVLVSFNKPEYPPIARRMKVEGTVVLALLVDESGKVLDVRLERGVQQNVGINEAATSAGRSAKFNPATKDGVRVKMWYQLTIPFRL